MILGFALMSLGQQPVLPSQPRYRVGVSFDKMNNQFGVSYLPFKKNIFKYELGLTVFNLRDEDMKHQRIHNYYTLQKTYRRDPCFLCGIIGGANYERGPDKILEGDTVNTYNGFYPKLAIPFSQAMYIHSKNNKRFSGILGAGYILTFTSGLKVRSNVVEINEIDNTLRAEIVRVKQEVYTQKMDRLIFGVFIDLGLEMRIGKSYYLGVGTKFGSNANALRSSIKYAGFANLCIKPSFSLSKYL